MHHHIKLVSNGYVAKMMLSGYGTDFFEDSNPHHDSDQEESDCIFQHATLAYNNVSTHKICSQKKLNSSNDRDQSHFLS